jgi:hypothetical protein
MVASIRGVLILTLLLLLMVRCKTQPPAVELRSDSSVIAEPALLRVIFDVTRSQLIGIDKSGNVLDTAVMSFKLTVRIQGQGYSEETKGCFLSTAMLELLKKTDAASIVYFEHIQTKDAYGNVSKAPDFQFNIGYPYKQKK